MKIDFCCYWFYNVFSKVGVPKLKKKKKIVPFRKLQKFGYHFHRGHLVQLSTISEYKVPVIEFQLLNKNEVNYLEVS